MASAAGRIATTLSTARRAAGQRRVPFLSQEARRELRDRRARSLVRYAAETVPHYRDLFADGGIDPAGIDTAEELAKLPQVDRAMVGADPGRFTSTSERARDSLRFPTNGTTGTPLVIRHDRRSVVENIALGERERVVESHFTGKRARYSVIDVNYGPRDTGFQILRFYREATAIPIRPERHMLRMDDPFETVVEAVNRGRPDVLQGYGSYLEAFFERLADTGTEMHTPSLVLYGSDTMSPEGRAFIEERFGVPVISRYNAVEALKIGFVCEARSGIHVEDDLCDLRVLDADGRPAAPGELGEVVISNLVNHGTVLLNYRLGDLAAWSAEPCECGRLTPLLSGVEGRLERTLRVNGGRFVPEGAIQVMLKDRGALSFQLVQTAPEEFDLKLVAHTADEYERIVPGALDGLRELLGDGTRVRPTFHESLPPAPRGVFQYVVPL